MTPVGAGGGLAPPPAGFAFDNRGAAVAGDGGVRRHFWIEHAGRSIGFCYIRKNACSSFKALLLGESPHRQAADEADAYRFMRRHHAAKLGRLERCDHVVLVVREPLGRVASAFRNKFVQRAGSAAIFASYRAIAGLEPQTATFRDFVERYLSRRGAVLDKHVRPQVHHLLPLRYTDAVPMERLHAGMVAVFGRATADRYFGEPLNSSRGAGPLDPAGAADTPADALHRRYRETGRLPSDAALMPPELAARCAALYAEDAGLYRRIAEAWRAPQ